MLNGLLKLTRDAVGRVARALITLNGETTTLEVKQKLRLLGFYARQDQVREFMLDITSEDGDLVYETRQIPSLLGITEYRVYKFSVPFPEVDVFSKHPGKGWHIFDYKNICGLCGLSKGAVETWNWQCAGKKTEIGQSKWLRDSAHITVINNPGSGVSFGFKMGGQNTTVTHQPNPVTTNTVTHRDDVRTTYTVTDHEGNDYRLFYNVTRSEAKHLWARDTGRKFFEARTHKNG